MNMNGTTKARLDRLTDEAVVFLRKAEKLALKMDARGIHVAFSGGKDSQVLLALAEMAGVRHHAEMQLTSVDPPQVVRFVRENYPQVHLNRPRISMYKLITKKHILPTRVIRYCCAEFKEFAGRGSVTATGIRRAESARRKKRNAVEMNGGSYDINGEELVELDENTFFSAERKETVHCVGNKDKVIINPILDWTDADVWGFLDYHGIPHCSLYDMGYNRIGCILCPMAANKQAKRDLRNFPRFVEKVYLRAIRTLMAQGYFADFFDEYETLDWWLSKMNKKEYLYKKECKMNEIKAYKYGGTELPTPQDNFKDISFIYKGETKARRGFVYEQKIMYNGKLHSFDEIEHWRFIHNKIED